jgi:hypothetical protein
MNKIGLKRLVGLALAGVWMSILALTGGAATKTWSGSGNWGDANWSPSAPLAGDDAFISSGTVTVDVETVYLGSFSNSATVVFSGWNSILHATNVTVNATITHPPQSDTSGTYNSTNGWDPDNRVYIDCSNLTVLAGKAIDVDGKGFVGRLNTTGCGPGGSGSAGDTDNGGPGGSYGGKGGDGYSGTIANTYGELNAPVWPGSAGGHPGVQGSGSGASGGGAVRIVASGTIWLDGSISAKGATGSASCGGGSGGGVYIDCANLEGTNTIMVAGGSTTSYGGGGGGGRIAVYYSGRLRDGGYTVAGGSGYRASNPGTYYTRATANSLFVTGSPAEHGSLTPYTQDFTYSISTATVVTNSVNSPADIVNGAAFNCIGWNATTNGVLTASGFTTQAVFTVTADTVLTYLWTNAYELVVSAATNGSVTTASNGWYVAGTTVGGLLATPDSGCQFLQWSGDVPASMVTNNPLTITVDQRRWIVAHFASATEVYTRTNAAGGDWFAWTNWSPKGIPGPGDSALLSAGTTTIANPTALSNLTVASGAALQASGWDTLLAASGAVTVSGTVTHAVQSDTNGTYNSTNGWTPNARIYIQCLTLNVPVGGKIDVSAKGYQGLAGTTGCGPGGSQTGNRGAGGSYGGRGGYSYDKQSANTYGSSNAPVDPGSAGGGYGTGRGLNGGGVVRIVASGDVQLDGMVAANGEGPSSSGVGCGSGGSVYIDCNRLLGGGWLCATGGVGTASYSSGGGGGRIAVVYAGNISVQLNVSVAGGRSANFGEAIITHGATGTYVTVSTGVPLTIGGDPAPHGTPTPLAYGNQSVSPGATITNSVDSPADTTGGTRYACIGWVAATGGVVIASGATTTAVVTVGVPTVLTYRWTNEYLLAVETSTNGTVSAPNGWHTNGTAAGGIQATANSGYEFVQWSGDVSAANCRDNPLSVAMTQPRTIVAHFASTGAGTTRSRASGGDWFAWTNWSPMGVPGPRDSVTIASGAVAVSLPVNLAGLAISNGATLTLGWWDPPLTVDGDVTVAGTLAHADNTDTTGTIGQTNWTPNARINLVCRDLIVTGTLDANGHGYRGGAPGFPSRGPGGVASAGWGRGGGYGGVGGRNYGNEAGGITYGDSQTPIGPGSGGGSDPRSGGHGGGAIRVQASRRIRVDGTVRATGGTGAGGGSGGAIFLTARVFEGSGTVEAKGANSTVAGGGGGGGGRIAIAAVRFDWSGSLAHPSSVAGGIRSAAGGQETDGAPGTLEWITIPPRGTIIILK